MTARVVSSDLVYTPGQIASTTQTPEGRLKVDAAGTIALPVSGAASAAAVPSSATVVTLRAANTARKGLTIFNDSSAALTIKLGAAASQSDFTTKIAAGGYYEVPFRYTGIVTGLWASANGNALVTELA